MPAQRHIERHQLPYFLKVFNRITDKPMGSLGNVSRDGLMLISSLPLLLGARFDMRLKIPGKDAPHYIDFSATCQWSREDVTPGTYDSGFALLSAPQDYVDMVDALHRYFSFYPLSTSA
ncbi:PilZ domain-containing protein [Pseudomonas cuatrocienegasensis]|uniref:PilZ domain-containing protein n=1 Tax=Pseudomonas cuatrocienegasensis TaxID=543360 RepID=A0ABY1BDJ6_9PSED|nr:MULTISPECIES: PilZ domain-containing protein [Pseudomonas]OEC33808.1 pilus assembly protein PilZ [Pseudomonas sp. 21C1]SEQ60083.1 PilZ domain-containing protein [Pseudomonas cuatrocienegasensis]